MTFEDLKDLMKSKGQLGQSLAFNLEKIKTRAEPLLKEIAKTFPEYTAHDISHSEELIKKLNMLIPTSLKEKINEYEIYFLLGLDVE